MEPALRLDDCHCGYCRYPGEISTPDTAGEYGGIDEHMQKLERRLREAIGLLGRCKCGQIDHDHDWEYRDTRDEFLRRNR